MTKPNDKPIVVNSHFDRLLQDHLYKKIWVTRASRFNAERRLVLNSTLAIISISMLSLSVVSLSILELAYADFISKTMQSTISATTMILSIFIIILSMIEFNNDRGIAARSLKENTRKISELFNEYEEYSAEDLPAKSMDVADRYSRLLTSCPYTHNYVDYVLVQYTDSRALGLSGGQRIRCMIKFICLMLFEKFLYISFIFGAFFIVTAFAFNIIPRGI